MPFSYATVPTLRVMREVLRRRGQRETIFARSVAEGLNMDARTVSRMLQRMTESGWLAIVKGQRVKKTGNPPTFYIVTPGGAEAMARLLEQHRNRLPQEG